MYGIVKAYLRTREKLTPETGRFRTSEFFDSDLQTVSKVAVPG